MIFFFYRVNSYTISQFHTQEWKKKQQKKQQHKKSRKKHLTEELAISWFRNTGRENETTSTQILQ